MPDGRLGFVGDEASVPPGATILDGGSGRGSLTIAPALPQPEEVPSPEELKAAVRARCAAKWRDDHQRVGYCIRQRTRYALDYRDLLLRYPPGSEGRAMVLECRDEWSEGLAVDYARAGKCAQEEHAEFVRRHGGDPASLSLEAGPTATERGRQHQYRVQQERLDRLLAERDAQEEEERRGRAVWGSKYDQASRELERAEDRTQSIVDSVLRRGCRIDSWCGGLKPRLSEARRKEADKRRYLTHGLVDECRRAGCQPGWLR
jgi:hypothetical protein